MADKRMNATLTVTNLCCLLALMMLDRLGITEGQMSPISLTLTSPEDVTSGETLCPNTRVEFTCVAVDTTLLTWQRNGVEIRTLSFRTTVRKFQEDFTVFLDKTIFSADNSSADMTSRLLFNLSNVMSGDRITCVEVTNAESTVMLNYRNRSVPNSLQQSDFTMTIISDHNNEILISITWSPNFTSVHDVTNYRVVTGSSVARCPSMCLPIEPCQCTGVVAGENITINISAINCGNQEGPALMLVARPTVPSQPSMCSGLAVYNYIGDFIGIAFSWRRVDNLPEFITGVRQDVARYFVMAEGFDTQTVSASTACLTDSCSHLFLLSLSSSQSPIKGSVAADNVFGQGPSCTLQELRPDQRNQIFTLEISSTDGNNHVVECAQVTPMGQGIFECEFCYIADTSCQNLQSGSCIIINGSAAILPLLTEVTYCYRATARINGTPVAVIQDKLSTVPLSGPNIAFLVISVLLWLASAVLKAFETVYIVIVWCKLRIGTKFFSITLRRLQKIIYILLLIAGYTLLFVVVILWIMFGVAVGNPNMMTLRDSSIIAAFVFSLLAFTVVTIILIMIVYIIRQKYRTHPSKDNDNQVQGAGSMKPLVPEEMYAQPNGQQPSDDADEHRMKQNAPNPGSKPKSKGVVVKKKQKNVNKIEPQSQPMEEYDQLKGTGRHMDTDLDDRPTPTSPPIPGQYGKLNRKGEQEQYSVPYDSKAVSTVERYETMSGLKFPISGDQAKRTVTQTDGSGIPEYSIVDKKKKKSKPK